MPEYPPRILRVRYRSLLGRRRVAEFYIKVPYSGLFNMTEVLARAVATRQVMWFRVDVPEVIDPSMRASLVRWPVAFAASSLYTGVNWNE